MNVRLESDESGVMQLIFDRPGVNVFDRQTLTDLEQCISELESKADVTGLILRSAHSSVFIAGADLHTLKKETHPARLEELSREGQRIFQRLAALPFTKVAAIHGACLGGGYECTLACDYRLASPNRSTRIGLPETSLGILPAWGGCTFLPRLVGVPTAVDVILNGRRLVAVQAKKRGMVDAVIPAERLMEHAQRWVQKPPRPARRWSFLDSRLGAGLIQLKAGKALEEKTHGHYPAPVAALRLLLRSLHMPVDKSLQEEASQFSRLACTDVSKNLIRLFFLQEAARKIRVSDVSVEPCKRVAVIGSGVMGAGIAQWCASKGMQVVLKDIAPEAVSKGLATIRKLTQKAVQKRIMSKADGQALMDRILPAHTELSFRNTDVVIEAIVERMDIKEQLFHELGRLSGPHTLLASNTSALSVSDMAKASSDPGRVCGIHFFNPVHQMALVEVVQARSTHVDALQQALALVQQLGKTPVVVQDRPGFVVNRVLMPYLLEAGRLHEEGYSIRELDAAMLAFGMPMGPMRLMDEIGVDVCLHVADFLCRELTHLPAAPNLLADMVKAKKLGRKGGGGFYTYGRKRPLPKEQNQKQESLQSPGASVSDLQDMMVFPMINEAARILDEKVASTPADVDLAMVLGTGFAPFTGGPLRYADSRGLSSLVEDMKKLSEGPGEHLAPCEFLCRLADEGRKFYSESGSS